ncbi:BZ3500_MvSof-1268-A1-R1_Chr5-2g08124 [Microbotryum saponariae]|uniref:BZ3500_MvSof-1268-A1-R1_Chr5-2g08124 protein n=1 Tax=Microbotryum saponariae TaxID=289078 RepID=A0A2X0KN13_9BASI|nr:BZ3500_MvSof-1268-A1-R1_Chr5-2g08124 [Microbotryum saponariae]SDA05993.1 BZ3501_MvSof-1269-A2-R1_Chr5-2g07946 [Microbotryum saponariae]
MLVLGWLSDRHSEERTGESAPVVHDKSSQPEQDNDWMPYSRPSKTEGATERIFDAAEFHRKNIHLKFPSVDWSEARLVVEGDDECGMEYLCAPQLVPGLPCLSASSALPMTAEELQEHLDPGVVYVQELPPAYLKFKDQDGEGRFYTKTVRIESRMTVACTEDKPRIVTRSDFNRKELGGQGAQVGAIFV